MPVGLQKLQSEGKRRTGVTGEKFSIFWACLWLCIAMVAIKTAHYEVPEDITVPDVLEYLDKIVVLSGNDILFVICLGGVARLLLKAVRRDPAARRLVGVGFAVSCTVCLIYAIVSLRVYEILRTPLTYPLLRLGGNLSNMSSSIGKFVTLPLVLTLLAAPVAYVLAVAWCSRFLSGNPVRLRRVQGISVFVAVIWFQHSRHTFAKWANTRQDYALGLNPHYTMAASYIRAFLGSSIKLDESYPAEYLDDFKTFRERAADTAPTPGLNRGPKNVIVVICESVGAQQLSLYGSRFKTWPRMEAEAANALVFDNYYSHITNTANSLYTLTLSSYPSLTWREMTEEQPDAPGISLAQVLKTHGYRTAYVSAGYNEWAKQDLFVKNRGYDVVKDAETATRAGIPEISSWGVEDRCMVDMILDFVDQKDAGGKPFYVFSWTQATHHPYDAGPNWEERDYLGGDESYRDMSYDLNKYLNALYELDKQLARLMDGLRERHLENDTLVVITGDHGEAFGWPREGNRSHSEMVNEENVNVPFILWSPSLFHSPPRSSAPGAHVDLNATVLDLLGYPAPSQWHGRSILSPRHPPRSYFYGVLNNFYLGVRENQYKYIFNATSAEDELYDLEKDRLEMHNIAATFPDKCKILRQRVSAWVHYQQEH
jgi:arylsulfatase A-like enzyme